jgi:L-lactate dehydrogenase complex protein LldG
VDRDSFLARIAERMGRGRIHSPPPRAGSGVSDSYKHAPLGEWTGGRIARFKLELEAVGAKVGIATSLAGVAELVRAELDFWKAGRVVAWARAELASWGLDPWLAEGTCRYWDPSDSAEFEAFRATALEADVGITAVDFAVVNTGTLALSAAPGRPRCVSLLPTVHLALVREDQLVDRIGQALTSYCQSAATVPSALHFITGPSRTSDIENDLSIGVHGPAAVSVIVWQNAGSPTNGAG